MLITPSEEPPAGTLLGETGVWIEMLNDRGTCNTANLCDAVSVSVPAVPVMVTEYVFAGQFAVVFPLVYVVTTVTDAPVGGVTVCGLTVQPAFPFGGAGEIWQPRATEPLKPFKLLMTRLAESLPPGLTAGVVKAFI
jgi:hypothetical protein